MSQVTSLIDKIPILPIIEITKNDDTTYTFNSFTSTFDFRVLRCQIKPPFDAVGGTFSVTITSSDGSNSGMNTILNNIEEGNEILFYVGKDDSGKTKLMRGTIEDIDIDESNPNFMSVTLGGPDWGSDLLKNRVVNGQWVQKRLANGDLDTSDNTTTVQQIVLDLLQVDQSYPSFLNGSGLTAEDQGVVVNSANILPINYRLSDFHANMEFLDDKLQELDDLGGSVHYIDADKTFHMKQTFVATNTLTAEILITDDNADSVGTTWVDGKVGLMGENSVYKRTLEHHKRRLFGVGGVNEALDQEETDTSSSTKLDANYLAMSFVPEHRLLHKIVLNLGKVGTPLDDFVMDLREDKNGLPTGDVIRTIVKPKAFLTGAGPTISPFDIGEELDVGDTYWIVLHKQGDSSNTFQWFHDNTDNSPSRSATSSDDVTWAATTTPNRYNYSFQTYRGSPVIDVHYKQNLTATSKHLHEDVIRKADIRDKKVLGFLLRQQGETLFRRKEVWSGKVYVPDTLLQNGMKVRIRKQASGYKFDADFIIGSIEYFFEGSEDQAVGQFYYDIQATRYVDYD